MGENWVVRGGKIGLFLGSANFCQCFIGHLPCGGRLGCSVGNSIQLLPALKVNIIIVHPRGVLFPEDFSLRVNNYDVYASAGNNCFIIPKLYLQ